MCAAVLKVDHIGVVRGLQQGKLAPADLPAPSVEALQERVPGQRDLGLSLFGVQKDLGVQYTRPKGNAQGHSNAKLSHHHTNSKNCDRLYHSF